MTAESAARWTVVVPVKPAAVGKSRLEIDGVDRAALARAIALDTLAVVAACELVARVIVVTDDAALPLHAGDIAGVRWVNETAARQQQAADALAGRVGAMAPEGLDGAVALGMRSAGERMPRAALLGDLPALRTEDLAAALQHAASVPRAVVADTEGTGSTLVTAAPDVAWLSSFGDGSFARHVALGCVALEIPEASTLRRDVDTAAQLAAARPLGLGPRTAALVGD